MINYCFWFRSVMSPIARQFKQIIITAIFLLVAAVATSQVKPPTPSNQLRNFSKETVEDGMEFIFPDGVREIPAVNTVDFPFDYAMSLPGKDFEIWFMVRSTKKYPRVPPTEGFNTDSTYNYMAETVARGLHRQPCSFRTCYPGRYPRTL